MLKLLQRCTNKTNQVKTSETKKTRHTVLHMEAVEELDPHHRQPSFTAEPPFHHIALGAIEIGACSIKGQYHEVERQPNQDQYCLHQNPNLQLLILGVFDGHGTCGAIISTIIRTKLPLLICDLVSQEKLSLRECILQAFANMNAELHLMKDAEFSGSTGTIVVVDKRNEQIVIGFVGDSEIMLGYSQHPDQQPIPYGIVAEKASVPHRVTNVAERQRILACGGSIRGLYVTLPENQRCILQMHLQVTRTFGDFELGTAGIISVPELITKPLKGCKFIAIASDGLWDSATEREIELCLKAERSKGAQCLSEALVDLSDRMDDVTAVVALL